MAIDPAPLHDAIAHLADTLPAGWVRVFQLVEMYTDGSGGTLATYYVDEAEPDAVRFVSLPASHLLKWRVVWAAMNRTTDPFTRATVILNDDGKFDVDYAYEPLSDDPPLVRQRRWLEAVARGYSVHHAPAR